MRITNFLTVLLFTFISLNASEINVNNNQDSLIIEETDCHSVYKAAKDSALEQGLSQDAAMSIGRAAFHACRDQEARIRRLELSAN